MKRDIEWKEKLDDGVKLTVRVKFPGKGQVKWQYKRSDEEQWDYETPATPEQWEMLESKMEQLYNRRRAAFRDLELVQKLRKEHG